MQTKKSISYFQPVIVMPLVQAVCNVLIQQDNVPVMLAIRVPNVMLLVVVIQQVQVVQHVMLLLANALAKLDTQELHVIHVRQITTKQVMVLLVPVSVLLLICVKKLFLITFYPS